MKTAFNRGTSLRRSRRWYVHREWLVLAAAVVVAWLAGNAIAAGGRRGMLAMAVGIAILGGLAVGAIARVRPKAGFEAVELPVFLILLTELVFRARDAESLASNPLDTAGLFRVACLGGALLLAALALTSPIRHGRDRVTTRPFRLYCLYVLVVFVGAPLSVNLPLTAFRGMELTVGILALAGAFRRVGPGAGDRILGVIYWFTAASALVIWLEAVAMPGSAFSSIDSPFPFQLHGVFPLFAANTTGTIGALLGLWSLSRLMSPSDRGQTSVRTLRFLTALGFMTLIFAQYRTGFVVTFVGLLLILGFRGRAAAFWFIMAGLLVATLWGGQIVKGAAPVVQRGENPEVLSRLSGRLNYWEAAVPVWKESPLFGRGLLTASRFEVLAKLGSVYTSSIHGTWVEALVGTGLVGFALLAGTVFITTARAFREAMRPDGRIVPLVLIVSLLVRSLTGPTFEVAGRSSLLLLTIALMFRDRPRVPVHEPVGTIR
jgi:O-antigen ligase